MGLVVRSASLAPDIPASLWGGGSNIRDAGQLQNKVTQSPLLSGFVSHTHAHVYIHLTAWLLGKVHHLPWIVSLSTY